MRPDLTALRTQIRAIETEGCLALSYLPIGADMLDAALGGGLALGGVTEVVPAAFMDEPVSLHFAFACMAKALHQRCGDLVVIEDASRGQGWGRAWGQLYGPGLQKLGVCPSRILLIRAPDVQSFHACVEDAARTFGLAGVLAVSGSKAGFSLAGARRVQLAAEQAHSLVLTVQGLRTSAFAPARARLVIASRPCRPVLLGTALPGLGPPAWRLHLERARNGARPQTFDLEYDDATHSLYQPATLANRSPQPQRLSA
jgi:protein ImuA